MPDAGKPLTVHDAARIRSEWAAGRADLDDIGRALDTLVWALGQRDRAVRVMRRLAEGPWPGVREVVGELEEWLAETAPAPLKKPVEQRRRW
jgi:phage-related minor tail protein